LGTTALFIVFLVGGAATLACIPRLVRATRGKPIAERWVIVLLPIWVYIIVWNWIATTAYVPVLPNWSAARLAPAMIEQAGYKLYHPSNSGPAIGWIYPPVATLAYRPATWIKNVIGAVLAGRFLSLFYFFAPAAWILMRRMGREPTPLWIRVLLLVTFALVSNFVPALRYNSTEIHADAPALGLAALAVGVMAINPGTEGRWQRMLALVLATLAVWTKQLSAPILLIALPAWAFLTGGVKGLFHLIVAAVVIGVALSLVFLAVYDAPDEIFNILTIPALHPYRVGAVGEGWTLLISLEERYLLLTFLLMFVGTGMSVVRPWQWGDAASEPGETPWWRRLEILRRESWLLFLLVGMAELPMAVIGYIKVGGDDNNLGFSVYFLTLGGLLALERLIMTRQTDSLSVSSDDRTTWITLGVVGLNLALAILASHQTALAVAPERFTWRHEQAGVIKYIREHKGEVYFPWNPLEHLAVEGKAYHFEYGVYDRKLAGYPLTMEHFRKFIPPNTREVVYPRYVAGERVVMEYFPGYVKTRNNMPGLPEWSCYEPDPDANNPPPDEAATSESTETQGPSESRKDPEAKP
jgi:hypothetical protein